MSSLVPGDQYGLSSHSDFYENKSLIMVKLTDSAQRAIEEYLENKKKINQNPTIQFVENEGRLSFPSTKSNHGNFTFSLADNQDIEGARGGFECIQQTGPEKLESLGALFCKMRIQANDDSFETTRHRMQAVEVNNKNKCTRVLKSDDTVGKKVKVKGTVKKILGPNSSNLCTSPKRRDFSNSSTSLSQAHKAAVNSVARSQVDVQRKSPDIMSRSLKERLIHLLALRPLKKPELHERLHSDGIRKTEKKLVTTVLKQISQARDDTYHLHKSLWSDVQEDWPFYTDQEKALLKIRKLQNIGAPSSTTNGASSPGVSKQQSPNSPRVVTSSVDLINIKRPGSDQATEAFPTKRQKISQKQREHEERQAQSVKMLDARDGDRLNDDVSSLASKPVKSDASSTNGRTTNHRSNIDSHNHNQHQHTSHRQRDKHSFSMPKTDNGEDVSTLLSEESNPMYAIPKVNSRSMSTNKYQPSNQSNQSDKNYDPSGSIDISDYAHTAEDSDKYNNDKCPDYLVTFTAIKSLEQRAQYKAEYRAHDHDYKKLLDKNSQISARFLFLGEELKKHINSGNKQGERDTRQEIYEEYSRTKYIKARFNYIHGKLSHIQKLISDFDALLKQK